MPLAKEVKTKNTERVSLRNLRFHLRSDVGNSRVREALNIFEKQLKKGVKGPYSAEALFSLMAPIDSDRVKNKLDVIKDSSAITESFYEQVKWVNKPKSEPTSDQIRILNQLLANSLKSLAQDPQYRKGRELTPELRERAQKLYEEFSMALKKIDKDKNGHSLLGLSLLTGAIMSVVIGINHIVNNLGVVDSEMNANSTIVLSPTPLPSEVKYLTFSELWDRYFMIQRGSKDKKGYSPDLQQYCTQYGGSAGCGFNENDPNFDSQFHGHFNGFTSIFKDGKWLYIEKAPVVQTPRK